MFVVFYKNFKFYNFTILIQEIGCAISSNTFKVTHI